MYAEYAANQRERPYPTHQDLASAILSDGNQATQPTLIGSVLDDLESLSRIAYVTNSNLIDARQRLFGPWPCSDSASALKEAPAPSMEARLADSLSKLRSVLLAIEDNSQVLNARV